MANWKMLLTLPCALSLLWWRWRSLLCRLGGEAAKATQQERASLIPKGASFDAPFGCILQPDDLTAALSSRIFWLHFATRIYERLGYVMDSLAQPDGNPDPIAPREQLPVTYFGGVVLAVRHPDGSIYLSIRDLCLIIGLNRSSQMRRLRAHTNLSQGLALFMVQTAGGVQHQEFLMLEKVPTWLLSVTSNVLVERQAQIETSQDRAREAWRHMAAQIRALTDRLTELEQQVEGRLTRGQRGHLYQIGASMGGCEGATRGADQSACRIPDGVGGAESTLSGRPLRRHSCRALS